MVNKKIMTIILGLFLVTGFVSACGGWFEPECLDNLDSLETEKVRMGTSFLAEEKYTEANQQRLIAASKMPKLTRSLERENLIKRYELLNDENKIFYVYLISYGKVLAYYTAQGKVSSVNSRLTQQQQVLDVTHLGIQSYQSNDAVIVDSPQLDGSYGTNGDGIFFFTTEGAYVEWTGEYIVSDFPMKISTPPELVRTI